jgi:transketolase
MPEVVEVIHESGATSRMTKKAFTTRFANEGWRLANPTDLVESTDENIAEVLALVGDDPAKAAAAIDVEAAGKNRPTLIEKLTAIVDGGGNAGTAPGKG